MASSTYYTNSDPGYWPYHPLSDIRMDQAMYPTSTCHQLPQSHHPTPTYPADSALPSPPSSLLETLLRHGKQAISDSYPALSKLPFRPSDCSLPSQSSSSTLLESLLQKPGEVESYSTPAGNPSPGHPTPSQIPSHTPPYTPTSSSDRNSPMSGLVIDSSSQETYPPARPAEYPGINYASYPTYASTNLGNCAAPIVPSTTYDSMNPGYSYGNNNNNGKSSPTGSCDYDEPQPKMGDYAWMKSNYASGESQFREKSLLSYVQISIIII